MPISDWSSDVCSSDLGAAGVLFDRMLAAIGRDRSSVYLAPLCAIRPVSGQIPADLGPPLAEIALHRLALCRPKRLLLMGNAASRALLGVNAAAGRGCLHVLNYAAGHTETGERRAVCGGRGSQNVLNRGDA